MERSEAAFRKFEGLPESNGLLRGALGGPVRIDLNGLKFDVDILGGHKTGPLPGPAAELPNGGRADWPRPARCWIVSVFWADSVCIARGPARRAFTAWSRARRRARRRNATRNSTGWPAGAPLKPSTSLTGSRRRRPSGRTRGSSRDSTPLYLTRRPSPARAPPWRTPCAGYKEIHLRALKLLKPGGTLATFCCSHHVDAALFEAVILEAAFDARRILRRVAILQPIARPPGFAGGAGDGVFQRVRV